VLCECISLCGDASPTLHLISEHQSLGFLLQASHIGIFAIVFFLRCFKQKTLEVI
jgi:hypothetical protein